MGVDSLLVSGRILKNRQRSARKWAWVMLVNESVWAFRVYDVPAIGPGWKVELRRGRNKRFTATSCVLAEIFLPEHEQPCSSFKTRHQADASLLFSMGTVTPMCKCCDLSGHLRTNRNKVGKELGLTLLH